MRTWGPPGARYPMTRPGPGRKFLKGSSALMRHSIACPCVCHISGQEVPCMYSYNVHTEVPVRCPLQAQF